MAESLSYHLVFTSDDARVRQTLQAQKVLALLVISPAEYRDGWPRDGAWLPLGLLTPHLAAAINRLEAKRGLEGRTPYIDGHTADLRALAGHFERVAHLEWEPERQRWTFEIACRGRTGMLGFDATASPGRREGLSPLDALAPGEQAWLANALVTTPSALRRSLAGADVAGFCRENGLPLLPGFDERTIWDDRAVRTRAGNGYAVYQHEHPLP
jgi:hypothetical protein